MHKAYSLADEVFNEIDSFNSGEEWMNVSSMFEVFGSKSPSKKDLNDLATLLECAGYKRNSQKQFLVPTIYKAPVSSPVESVIDFNEFDFGDDSDDSEELLGGLAS